ncbi:hypothetical protein GOP47_0013175 [Adiantum capillus-veneris]|uniref:Arginyl-tRNA--protein transferase n=1 Tax=Adiantum capillus-veneris TaxID=13818 RepID=A0A9D4UN20_ADICA|nr:hypothetical protein GOP47_0013175 [Adiantum capillus-veneris]
MLSSMMNVLAGLWAHSLSPYDYQELLDQNWRRSGMVLYRPELERSCCPAYTIRLKAGCMEKSSEHVRAMRRMQRYLDGVYSSPSSGRKETELAEEVMDIDVKPHYERLNTNIDINLATHCTKVSKLNEGKQKCADRDSIADMLCTKVDQAIKECILHGELPDNFKVSNIVVQTFQKRLPRRGRKSSNNEISYTSSIAFPCAAALLRQRSDCKFLNLAHSRGANNVEGKATISDVAPLLAERIACRLQTCMLDKFRVEAYKGHLNFISDHSDSSINTKLFATSNIADGFADPKSKKSTEKPLLNQTWQPVKEECAVKHTIKIRTTNSVFDREEFSLYRRYQIAIHNENPEDVTELSFRRFLVDTPLTFVPASQEGGEFWGFGSFHQQYLIDGRLVAVGVIDILPSCLSSNYFFWDPDFAFLSLGRYSALKEIEWVQEAKKYCPTLEYYYLGHYIHSCPKMHYKVTFRPSELLCPIRFQWVPFDLARPLLDKQPFVCLSECLESMQKPDCKKGSTRVMDDNAVSSMTTDYQCNERETVGGTEVMQDCEAAANIANEDEMNNVLLKFDGDYLRFKHLREWFTLHDETLDDLRSKLQTYIRLVGSSLAAKMAYILV